MNSNIVFQHLLWGGLLFLLLAGCGQPRPDGLPNLYPVTLKFEQEGTPCAEAIVSLMPESDDPWAVGGITDTGGNVVLQTHGRYSGVPAGKYTITVTKTETELTGPPPKDIGEAQACTTYNLIDPVYSVPSSSTLALEVVAGENSFPPFSLGKKVREPVPTP